ncbi:Hypothetical predicted protein [Paramuricea clavata]|uniref:Uncharacterized protein n=2 Tax=Paramuricea clavata TaxID=317549 RepID=A0A7D9E9Q1_PARCT|nr:Hypothetical predicted protein [Paramuricea clavata]
MTPSRIFTALLFTSMMFYTSKARPLKPQCLHDCVPCPLGSLQSRRDLTLIGVTQIPEPVCPPCNPCGRDNVSPCQNIKCPKRQFCVIDVKTGTPKCTR